MSRAGPGRHRLARRRRRKPAASEATGHTPGSLQRHLRRDYSPVAQQFSAAAFTAALTTAFAFVLEGAWWPTAWAAAAATVAGAVLWRLRSRQLEVDRTFGTLNYLCVLGHGHGDRDEDTFVRLSRRFISTSPIVHSLAEGSFDAPGITDQRRALDHVYEQVRRARQYDPERTGQSLLTQCLWHFGVALGYRMGSTEDFDDYVIWQSQERRRIAERAAAEPGGERPARSLLQRANDPLDLREYVVDIGRLGAVAAPPATVDDLLGRYARPDDLDPTDHGTTLDAVTPTGDPGPVLVRLALTRRVVDAVTEPDRTLAALTARLQPSATYTFARPSSTIPDGRQAPLAIDAADYLHAVLDAHPHARVTVVAGITRAQQVVLGARLARRARHGDDLARIDFANHTGPGGGHYTLVRYAEPSAPAGPAAPAALPAAPPWDILATEVVNLTPHTIVVRPPDQPEATFPPSGRVARCTEHTDNVGTVRVDGHELGLVRQTLGELTGLGPPRPGVVYIVSRIAAMACPDRTDVFYPAGEIRDPSGRLVAVRSLGTTTQPTPTHA